MARSASDEEEDDDEATALLSSTDSAPLATAAVAASASAGRCDPAVRGLVVVTLCFTLLFGGWVPMENLLSTYEGELGYYSLMTVYIAVVPGSFVAPWIMHRAGSRGSMFIAAVPCEFASSRAAARGF